MSWKYKWVKLQDINSFQAKRWDDTTTDVDTDKEDKRQWVSWGAPVRASQGDEELIKDWWQDADGGGYTKE